MTDEIEINDALELDRARQYPGRPPRLEPAAYATLGAVFSIRLGTKNRVPVFANPVAAQTMVEGLKERAAATGVLVYAFCVMPDHIHLMLGPSEHCDVATFVAQFKNLAQRAAWKRGVKGAFWQPSFYDRLLRAEEFDRQLSYILRNPVRAALVKEWRAYPYSGSLVIDLERVVIVADAAE